MVSGRLIRSSLIFLLCWATLWGCSGEPEGTEDSGDSSLGNNPPVCLLPLVACGQECIDPQSHHDHCGTCNTACDGSSECKSGACVVTCPAGCPVGTECMRGTCQAKCAAPTARCGTECVDVTSSALHCGGCNKPCSGTCNQGVCEACQGPTCPCPLGTVRCGNECVDTKSSALHCGGCSQACSNGQSCVSGACACPSQTTLCNGQCVNLTTDSNHCGGCGTACGTGTTCVSGTCACSGSLMLCDGQCRDLQTEQDHCGMCGKSCGEGQGCENAECIAKANDDCSGVVSDATLTRASIYQAVEIPLLEANMAVPTAMRKAPLVQGRAALVRGFIEPKAGFQPRNLSLRLRLEGGKEDRVFYDKRMLGGVSAPQTLNSTFQIQVPAEAMEAGVSYSLELVDCAGANSPMSTPQRIPATGGIPLDAVETGTVKVAFLPISHDNRLPATDEAALKKYVDLVESQYPITHLEYTVVQPMESGSTGTNFSFEDLLQRVVTRRYEDGAPADLYYYGLIKPAQSFSQFCNRSCTTGIAYLVDDRPQSAVLRGGLGIAFDDNVSHGTFPHELGHSHGRDHAPCGVTGQQPFPYDEARIGSWGYDSLSSSLKSPAEFRDFMSYCSPTWISDFTYERLATRIQAANRPSAPLVHGKPQTFWIMLSTGTGVKWNGTMDLRGAPGTPEVAIVYDADGNAILEVEGSRTAMSDSDGFVLFVPAPQPGWAAIGPVGGPVLAY